MAAEIKNGEVASATMATYELEVQSGRRFRADNGMIWAVDGMAVTTDSLPHVLLIGVTDPTARKVISVNALMDKRLFNALEMENP